METPPAVTRTGLPSASNNSTGSSSSTLGDGSGSSPATAGPDRLWHKLIPKGGEGDAFGRTPAPAEHRDLDGVGAQQPLHPHQGPPRARLVLLANTTPQRQLQGLRRHHLHRAQPQQVTAHSPGAAAAPGVRPVSVTLSSPDARSPTAVPAVAEAGGVGPSARRTITPAKASSVGLAQTRVTALRVTDLASRKETPNRPVRSVTTEARE